jgi:alpha-glucosidase (family GH31 glycosyl hydrolase)
VYTMLLDNIHKMVNGGLSLQPYVHPDCGAHYGVPFLQETPEMFVRWAQVRTYSAASRCPSTLHVQSLQWTLI